MLTELKKLAGDFLTQPLTRGREIRDLLEHSPAEFCSAAVELLGGEDSERVQRYLVALLGTNNLLIPCLTDPSTPIEKAESIAALARRVDPQLPAKLVGFVLERSDTETPERLERILGLLKCMPDATSFRPLLTPLVRHPNPRVRAKVALLAGEGNRNRTWFERLMSEDDARVRANAIESAGPSVAEDLQPLFRAAASDSNNRVAGNAMVALYRLGESMAVANICEMASRADPAFRATAVWAMSETGDTRFLSLLAKIVTDPNETIKAAAFRAIRKLRAQPIARDGLEVRILGRPVFEGPALKIAFGVSDGRKPVPGIAATKIRILADGENVYRYSTKEQEYNRRISAAFLVPRIVDQTGERSVAYREALEQCFEQRQLGDAWLFSQYSGSAAVRDRPETLFGVRMDSPEASKFHAVATVADLHKAIGTTASIEFTAAFVALCQKLRPSRSSAHIFLFRPESAQPVDTASLTAAAREAHVSVHAVCNARDDEVREICQATSGFYAVSDNPGKTLAGFYRGISHRYLASFTPDAKIRHVQIAVHTADAFGESALCELAG
jgi:hypothetical protein